LKLKIQAPPVDNRANKAVESFLADLLGVPASRVTVVGGGASRHKRVEVAGLAPQAVADRLASAG
jgi:uncharacterized protein